MWNADFFLDYMKFGSLLVEKIWPCLCIMKYEKIRWIKLMF